MTEIKLMRYPLLITVVIGIILSAWATGFLLSENTNLSKGQIVSMKNEIFFDINGVRGGKWHIQTVDHLGDVGSYSSIGIDSSDRPHIGYRDLHNRYPKYAYYSESSWTTADVSQIGLGAQHMCLAMDSNDRPHLGYKEDAFVPQMMYSYHDGAKWIFTPVGFQLGHFISIAIDSNDKPHMSSYEFGGSLTYVSNIQGGNEEVEIVDQQDNVGQYTSIAMDSNDRPHISYWDLTNNNLKYAYYNGTAWLNETVDSKGNVGYYTSLKLDSNDDPHISYIDDTNKDVKYAYNHGNHWHNETVDSAENHETSLSLDSKDRPHIAYKSSGLKYAYHDGAKWNKEVVDSGREFGEYASIALDGNDNPHISYYDNNNKNLKYAVIDDIIPSVISDETPVIGTTGDPFPFSINAFDNIDVNSVNVDWAHGPLNGNLSLSKNEDQWEGTIQLGHDLRDLTYTIYLRDAVGNHNHSILNHVTVIDNDLPELVRDNSPDTGTTGDIFEFNLSVSDNIEVQSVEISWEHGETADKVSLDGNDSFWIASISLNQDLNNLSYIIRVNDTSGNSRAVMEKIIPVIDNDLPVLLEDITEDSPRTGESFNLSVAVSDSVEVTSVYVGYSFNDGIEKNESMTQDSLFIWELSIVVPIDARNISYTYYIGDAAGNLLITDSTSLSVVDTIPPYAKAGDDNTIGQHQTVTFNGSGSFDNGMIENYTWIFSYNGSDFFHYGMAVDFTFEDAGIYNVELRVADSVGNIGKDNLTISVRDISPPEAVAGKNLTIGQFDTISLDAGKSTDNVEIVNYTWEYVHNGTIYKIHDIMTIIKLEIPGNYTITLSVIDGAGLVDRDILFVTVLDLIPPLANFTIDGKYLIADNEYEIKVNGTVKFDGKISHDNVGISNYTWIIQGIGEEITMEGESTEYIFNKTGSFSITLIVKDIAGNTDQMTVSLKVVDDPDNLPDDDGPGASNKEKEAEISLWSIILIGFIGFFVIALLIVIIMRRSSKDKKPNEKSPLDNNTSINTPPITPPAPSPTRNGDLLNTAEPIPIISQSPATQQTAPQTQFDQTPLLPSDGQLTPALPLSHPEQLYIEPVAQTLELPPPPE